MPAVPPEEARVCSPLEAADSSRPVPRPSIRPLLWRLHFLGGFLVAPVVLWLAATGVLYAWHPQIEAAVYHDALTAVDGGPHKPLGEQVSVAQAEYPEWDLHGVVPSTGAEQQTTGVTLAPPDPDPAGGGHGHFGPPPGAVTVYVDPATGAVTGAITEANRPEQWLRSLHSSGHLGPRAEPLTELAASWVLVALLTGIYLWWPRSRKALKRAWRFRRRGRLRWRSIHTFVGVASLVGLLVVVATGLTWTNYAGTWLDLARQQTNSETPSPTTDLSRGAHADAEHEDHDGSHAAAAHGDPTAEVDRVLRGARQAGLDGVLTLVPPHEPGQAWIVELRERQWPVEITSAAIDPSNGTVTDRVDWDDYPLMGKATNVGIAFHEAELFGVPNQVGLTVLAVALVVLVGTGYRMWWLRRPAGGAGVLPPLGPMVRAAPATLLIGLALLLVLLPVLGAAFLVLLGVEGLMRALRARRSPPP